MTKDEALVEELEAKMRFCPQCYEYKLRGSDLHCYACVSKTIERLRQKIWSEAQECLSKLHPVSRET